MKKYQPELWDINSFPHNLKKLSYTEKEETRILEAVKQIDTALRLKNGMKQPSKYFWSSNPQGVYIQFDSSNKQLVWTYGEFLINIK